MQAIISSPLGSAAKIERCVCVACWKVPQAMGKVDTETENSRHVDMQAIETAAEAPAAPPSSKESFRRASIDSQWIGRGGGVGCGF
jgi:hypothetical protein